MFEGCWFTLTAAGGDTEKAELATLIRENGGRTFTNATLSLVQQRFYRHNPLLAWRWDQDVWRMAAYIAMASARNAPKPAPCAFFASITGANLTLACNGCPLLQDIARDLTKAGVRL